MIPLPTTVFPLFQPFVDKMPGVLRKKAKHIDWGEVLAVNHGSHTDRPLYGASSWTSSGTEEEAAGEPHCGQCRLPTPDADHGDEGRGGLLPGQAWHPIILRGWIFTTVM